MIAEMIVELTQSRTRLLVGALAVAGVLFVLYPIIRPFSDEASFQGAAAFVSTAWVVTHMLAIAGFILLMLGLLGVHRALQGSTVERRSLADRRKHGHGRHDPEEVWGLPPVERRAVRCQVCSLHSAVLRHATDPRGAQGARRQGVPLDRRDVMAAGG